MPDNNRPRQSRFHRYNEAEKKRSLRAVLQLPKELGTDHGHDQAGRRAALHWG